YQALDVLCHPRERELVRFLAAPPLSADDLKTLSGAQSLTPKRLREEPDKAVAAIKAVLAGLDPRRFPWVVSERPAEPTERFAAIVATAALSASARTQTARRSRGRELETAVKTALASVGYHEVPTVAVANSTQGPRVGEYCGECDVVGGKADVLVRLPDGRLAPIECKVSNSEVNSYKRLIHDCGEKAQTWTRVLGPANCVPIAALAGCYSLGNLRKAQEMGVTLVWAHELGALADFINSLP
ncbi:MAG: XamI family restriction endonuclease, partial [Bifidobacteriaceae bacterium]|nr:XamI family restriction endonuclease [Bifidobacteriaceae bacterium]